MVQYSKSISDWWNRHLPKITLAMISLMIAGMVYAFLQTTATERRARAQSIAITDLLVNLRDVVRTGIDAETGSRGYILTEDLSFLEPYERARSTWLTDIDQLEGKFAALGDDEKVLEVQRIRSLAERKLSFINHIVKLTANGQRDVAVAETKTKYGKLLLDNVRDIARDLERKERQRLILTVERADKIEYWITAILVGFLGLVIMLAYFSFCQERRAGRVALLDQQAFLLRQSKEQADLISRELNHRIKNLFAVILSLITLSARGSSDVPSTIEKVRNRIHALSLAHSVSQESSGIRLIEISDLLGATLAPYRNAHNVISYEGPDVALPTAAITPLGLIIHELATNALKYGALSVPEGSVMVHWEKTGDVDGLQVQISWIEKGGPPTAPDAKRGFGSSMIAASAQQLNGQAEHHWHERGLTVNLRFPLA